METKYLTWDGKELNVKYSYDPIFKKNTPLVKQTFQPSDALYNAIFSQESGVFNDKTAANMSLADRSSWLHLWDGVCCKSISPAEAYDCIKAKRVSESIRHARASNYMHLV